jgi:hypothetical protein
MAPTGKSSIQASIQVDLDLSRVKAQDLEVKRIQDQAEGRSAELKRRAAEISQGIEESQARMDRAFNRFKNKNIEGPIKNLTRGALGILAADIVTGFENSGADSSFLARAGSAAVFAAPGGPWASALATLSVTINSLTEAWKESKKEEVEIKKKILELEQRRRDQELELWARIEQIELDQRLASQRRAIEIDSIARELDYQTFRLMDAIGD